MATTNPFSEQTARSQRAVASRCRKDLVFTPVSRRSGMTYVVKDPVALQYTHLRDDEQFVLAQLDGTHSLEQICQSYEATFAPRKLSIVKLNELLFRLHQLGLLQSQTLGQGAVFSQRARDQFIRHWQQTLMSPLFIRFPGINPNRLLDSTMNWVRPCFHPLTIACMMSCMLAGLVLFVLHAEPFFTELYRLERWRQLESYLLLGAVIGATKVVHELAHAYTCKYYGGECRAIGPMLLLFSPALYCDTSDSWQIGNRWRRAAIGMAGVFVECFMAALATMVWLSTSTGLVHFLAMDVMLVCSVSTILFNANPLMRYDGYFVLSDLWDMPNLAERAQRLLVTTLRGKLLTGEAPSESLANADHFGMLIYGVASFLYRWFVTFTILLLIVKWARELGLESLGWMMAVFTLASVGMYFWRSGVRAMRSPAGLGWIRTRVVMTSIGISAATVILFFPLPARVSAVATITAHDAEPVYAVVPGFVEEMARVGQRIEAGQVVARLRNAAIELDYRAAKGRHDKQRQLVELLTRVTVLDPEQSRKTKEAQAHLEDLSTQLAFQQARLNSLTIKAPRSGLVLCGSEHVESENDGDQLHDWIGFVTDLRNQGCYVQGGTVLCQIVSPDQYEAELLLPQSTAKRVASGAPVSLVSASAPQNVYRGTVFQVSKRSMSSDRNDIDATEATSSLAEATKTSDVAYLLRVKLSGESSGALLVGQQSSALIRTAPASIAARVWMSLAALFRLR